MRQKAAFDYYAGVGSDLLALQMLVTLKDYSQERYLVTWNQEQALHRFQQKCRLILIESAAMGASCSDYSAELMTLIIFL